MFEDYQFERDPQKAETNLKKHGLSFERARTIWDDGRESTTTSATSPRPAGPSSQGSGRACTCRRS